MLATRIEQWATRLQNAQTLDEVSTQKSDLILSGGYLARGERMPNPSQYYKGANLPLLGVVSIT